MGSGQKGGCRGGGVRKVVLGFWGVRAFYNTYGLGSLGLRGSRGLCGPILALAPEA